MYLGGGGNHDFGAQVSANIAGVPAEIPMTLAAHHGACQCNQCQAQGLPLTPLSAYDSISPAFSVAGLSTTATEHDASDTFLGPECKSNTLDPRASLQTQVELLAQIGEHGESQSLPSTDYLGSHSGPHYMMGDNSHEHIKRTRAFLGDEQIVVPSNFRLAACSWTKVPKDGDNLDQQHEGDIPGLVLTTPEGDESWLVDSTYYDDCDTDIDIYMASSIGQGIGVSPARNVDTDLDMNMDVDGATGVTEARFVDMDGDTSMHIGINEGPDVELTTVDWGKEKQELENIVLEEEEEELEEKENDEQAAEENADIDWDTYIDWENGEKDGC